MNDEYYMQICLELAAKGYPNALPNPMVGCVIVHQNKIIGQGYHQKFGKEHAEVNAIARVENKNFLKESTLYVNLEPCSHFGKTPPCSDLIIKSKLKKVVIGYIDTFDKVNGKGIEKMKKAGIEVVTNVLEQDCISLNKRFYTFHNKKRPYIILKWAESKDGFIAPKNQNGPFWMTNNLSKRLVHKWRSIESAILVGKNTIIKDNPLLTNRYYDGPNPIRLVIDKDASLSQDYNIFNDHALTYVICQKQTQYHHLNINFENFFDQLFSSLYHKNISSLIVEGGRKTLEQFINSNNWDEARVFKTDKVLKNGVSAPKFNQTPSLSENIGNDTLSYFLNT